MHVKDIMKEEIVHVDKDQNIQDALKLMKKHKISRLPVVNMNDGNIRELVGIVTEKDISVKLGSSKYGNLPPSHFHVSTVMKQEPIVVQKNENIGIAAKTMLENKIGGMPVVNDCEIVGMLTKTDFLEICHGKPFNATSITERMNTDLITVSPSDRLVHARRCLIDKEIGRLPVVEEDMLEGILTAKDVAMAMISFKKVVPDKYKTARIRNLLVEDVMTQNVKTIDGSSTLDDAATFMLENRFSGIPVEVDGALGGIITKTDLMNFVVELEEVS
ncbi:MAG: CBS domain-containing protein [Methanobacterium sp.]|uniref:CBS domain-containing protein n=1 Tax=Methanobacterium sp. TaxID=2164 RepID=UPI003C73F00C